MDSQEIREKFMHFFERKGHKVISSASLVPQNDTSVLFTTAGMQPLVPYLLGERHPLGNRLVNIQKCVRTQDINEVGDNIHDTFFEMMGYWSLGDYFKENAIAFCYEFLTSASEGLALDPKRMYITVFTGNQDAPRDEESKKIWISAGIPENRIYYLESNWWSLGESGPCGPDTEIFYDLTEKGLGDLTHAEFLEADTRQDVVEIGNNVFIEYEKKNGTLGKLSQRNVDFGGGLERQTMAVQKKANIFETDIFAPIMDKINEFSNSEDERSKRIIADHVRTAVFIVSDGVTPSNTDRGYILRRLIRRAVRYADKLKMKHGSLFWIAQTVVEKYSSVYEELHTNVEKIRLEIDREEQIFRKTLEQGLKEFEKGTDAFTLFTTYGFPVELTEELAKEKGQSVDRTEFDKKMEEHVELSRTSSSGMFKGGLVNNNEKTVKLHTAHHLLLAALQEVVGKEVKQRGSNITEERLRMDFSSSRKLTADEIKKTQEIVNRHIQAAFPVVRREMPLIEAETLGAEMEFGAKYPEVVSLYFIEDKNGNAISKEFCGGPHVANTSELGHFKIIKEEAVSAGVRRIKAVLE